MASGPIKEQKQIAYLVKTLARLQGEMLATQFALRGLILAHPDRRAAIAAAASYIERAIASGLPAEIDEAFLDGLERGKQRVLPSQRDLDESVPK